MLKPTLKLYLGYIVSYRRINNRATLTCSRHSYCLKQ